MMTFTWCPSVGAQQQTTPRVRTSRFGDGYSQRVADGINTKQEVWNLGFVGLSDVDALAIETFLNDRGGHEAFLWETPSGVTIKVVAPEWTRDFTEKDVNTISTRFERVYDV